MNTQVMLKLSALVLAFGLSSPTLADPTSYTKTPDLSAARIMLASLHRDLEVHALPNMSPQIASPDFAWQPGAATRAPLLQIAGRCGSSDYYCDSPGYTYCCGNSTDGFYCAADVNGC
ncbi:hypothetical protein [Labrenzia sp. VG12]|uniref:hypothetical protein n=1 Tax=Labrenzia sp. VG12 TaxID=2021862 RepID=UPI0012FE6C4B|nr:hypothetical protein [Labrenzia sp. VG12]